MKKGLKALLLVLCCALLVLGLASCGGDDDGDTTAPGTTAPGTTAPGTTAPGGHTHSYTPSVTPPTCYARGYTTYVCTCGDSYVDDYVDETAHNLSSTVTPPTCTEKGYTTYTCQNQGCTHSYKDNYVDETAHVFDRTVAATEHLKTAADCEHAAVYYKSCACGANGGEADTFTSGEPLGHTGGSATCTELAICTRCNNPYGTTLAHVFDRTVAEQKHLKTAADCEHAAVYYKSCVCGENGGEGDTFTSGEPLGHTGGSATCTELAICTRCNNPYGTTAEHVFDCTIAEEKHLKTAADCENAAVYYKSCICGENGGESDTFTSGEPLGHTGGSASCTEQAVCTVCGNPYGELAKHIYNKEVVDSKYFVSAADCEHAAVYYKSCVCGEAGADTFTSGEPLGHSYESAVTAPTCTEAGYTTYTCSECGDEYTDDPKDATGHSYESVVTAPTCIAEGYTTYTCSECGDEYTGNNTQKIAHAEYEMTDSKASTCTERGYEVYTCKQEGCEDSYTVELLLASHAHVAGEPVLPTCTEKGYTTYTCSACGDSYVSDYVDANGHDYDEAVTAPGCETRGYTTYTCSECSDSYVGNYVDAAGHSYESAVTAPTCIAKGYTTYTCSECGDSYIDDYEAAVGHSYTLSDSKAPSCTEKGYETYACACGDSYTNESVALGHDLEGASWTPIVDGEGEAILTHVEGCLWHKTLEAECSECGETVTKTEDVEKHAHIAEITTEATCHRDGVRTYTCANCGNSYSEPIRDPEAHVWNNGDGSESGTVRYTCTVDGCGASKVTHSAKDKTETTISKDSLSDSSEVEMKEATIKMDEATHKQFEGLGGDITLYAGKLDADAWAEAIKNLSEEEKQKLGESPIFNFTITDGTAPVTNFNGLMTITVPYDLNGEDPDNIYVWFINDSGEIEGIKATYTLIDGKGYAVFETTHFSKYTVVRLTPAERCQLYEHNLKWRTVDPTCETAGYTLEYCVRCGHNKKIDPTDALGHSYESAETAPTCTEKGYTTYTCSACGDGYTDDYKDANGHDYDEAVTAPGCETRGYTTYTCSECGHSYVGGYLPATGHSYTEAVTLPTCGDKGYTEHTCTTCGASYRDSFVNATGHSYEETTVNATCAGEGYTEHTCSRCGASYRDAYVPRLGHQHEPSVTAPTCTEKGYTTYTCSGCGDSYRADFTAVTEHGYVAGEPILPTCTDRGYTLYTCPDCGKSYKGDFTAAVGHSYENFICTVCGANHPMLGVGNDEFYLNLIDSILSADSFLITAENLRVKYVTSSLYGSMENDSIVELYRMQIGFDDSGYLVGYGEGTMYSFAKIEDPKYYEYMENTVRSSVRVLFANGLIYTIQSNEITDGDGDKSAAERISISSQDILPEMMTNADLVAMMKSIFSEDVKEFLDGVKEDNCAVLNAAIESLVGKLFIKVPTEDGYRFTFDFAKLPDIYRDLRDLTVSALVDKILGEGVFDDIVDLTVGSLNRSVADFEADILARAAEYGVEAEELYEIVDLMIKNATGEEMSIKALLEESKDMLLSELLAERGMNVDVQFLEGFVESFRQMSLLETIFMVGGDMGGDMGGENVNPNPPADGKEDLEDPTIPEDGKDDEVLDENGKPIEKLNSDKVEIKDPVDGTEPEDGEAPEMADPILSTLEELVGKLGLSEISFTTDSDGNLLGFKLFFDNIEFTVSGEDSTDVTMSGSASVIPNATLDVDYEDMRELGDKLVGAADMQLGDMIGEYQVIAAADGTLYLARILDDESIMETEMLEDLGSETVDGVECRIFLVRTDYALYRLSGIGLDLSLTEDCGEWYSCELLLEGHYGTDYRVWMNDKMQVVRYSPMTEVDGESDEEAFNSYYYFTYYYNPVTDEFTREPIHRYEVTDEKLPVGCEEGGYCVYTCQKCGDSQKEILEPNHQYAERFELAEGAMSCEDGVYSVRYCTLCGKVMERYPMGDGHMSMNEKFQLKTGCGEITATLEGCLCGMSINHFDVSGKSCRFEESIDEESGNRTFVCLECGYTITFTRSFAVNGCEIEGTLSICFGVKEDGSADKCLTRSFKTVEHSGIRPDEDFDEEGNLIRTEYCDGCQTELSISKYDADGKQIYYKDCVTGEGWRRVYDGCYYEEYTFDASGDEWYSGGGEDHIWDESLELRGDSCEDGVRIIRCCKACGRSDGKGEVFYYHYESERAVLELETGCGFVGVYNNGCACGFFSDVRVMGDCSFGYVDDGEENGVYSEYYACSGCGYRYSINHYQTTEGCTERRITEYRFGLSEDGTFEENYIIAVTSTKHVATVVESTEGELTVYTKVCEFCGTELGVDKYDSLGRQVYSREQDGYGWRRVYDGCYYEEYGFSEFDEWYSGDGEDHEFRWTYVLLTGSRTCEDGAIGTYACRYCGTVDATETVFHHARFIAEDIVIRTPCGGEIALYREECACGREKVINRSWEHYSECNFDQRNDYYPEIDGRLDCKIDIYTCTECGFSYSVSDYVTKNTCTTEYYTEYAFGIEDGEADRTVSVMTWADVSHGDGEPNEWADDDGFHYYEFSCNVCGEAVEHYKYKDDEFDRRIYYYDYLTESGYRIVYGEGCSYFYYELGKDEIDGEMTVDKQHAGSVMTYELMPGSKTCKDGVYAMWVCGRCMEPLDEQAPEEFYEHVQFEQKYKFATECGEAALYYNACACGEMRDPSSVWLDMPCEMEQIDCREVLDSEGNGIGFIYTYRCAVTACAFTYTDSDISVRTGCTATRTRTFCFGAGADGSCEHEWIASAIEEAHELDWLTEDKGGHTEVKSVCRNCSDYISSWYITDRDEYGREIYYKDLLSEDGYGWERVFDENCNYVERHFTNDGYTGEDYSYYEHVMRFVDATQSCTQYNISYEVCIACGHGETYDYAMPTMHKYYYDDAEGTYICSTCGLRNETGANGYFIIEDLYKTQGWMYSAGFFNNSGAEYDFYIVFNYGLESAEKVAVKYELLPYMQSGIVILNEESLYREIDAFEAEFGVFKHVSIVFEVFDFDSGTYLDHVLTFDYSSEGEEGGDPEPEPEPPVDPEYPEAPVDPEYPVDPENPNPEYSDGKNGVSTQLEGSYASV